LIFFFIITQHKRIIFVCLLNLWIYFFSTFSSTIILIWVKKNILKNPKQLKKKSIIIDNKKKTNDFEWWSGIEWTKFNLDQHVLVVRQLIIESCQRSTLEVWALVIVYVNARILMVRISLILGPTIQYTLNPGVLKPGSTETINIGSQPTSNIQYTSCEYFY
jgi:hypothetical protein